MLALQHLSTQAQALGMLTFQQLSKLEDAKMLALRHLSTLTQHWICELFSVSENVKMLALRHLSTLSQHWKC